MKLKLIDGQEIEIHVSSDDYVHIYFFCYQPRTIRYRVRGTCKRILGKWYPNLECAAMKFEMKGRLENQIGKLLERQLTRTDLFDASLEEFAGCVQSLRKEVAQLEEKKKRLKILEKASPTETVMFTVAFGEYNGKVVPENCKDVKRLLFGEEVTFSYDRRYDSYTVMYRGKNLPIVAFPTVLKIKGQQVAFMLGEGDE